MADDIRPELKLSKQLVMTPQLQMAIKLLAMPSRELPVAQWMIDYPGLEDLAPGERDPLDIDEDSKTADDDPPPWYPADESPLPASSDVPDVWVFGNPPQARANRHAYPRLKASTMESKFVVRSLRQRARTYEKMVQSIVDLRPQLAVTLDPDQVEPVAVRELAEVMGMHESTIERVAKAVRFQNLHGIVTLAKKGKKLGFVRG